MKQITNDELIKLVSDKVQNLYEKNEEFLGSKVVLPTAIAQIAVFSTLQILEEMGILTLPKKD